MIPGCIRPQALSPQMIIFRVTVGRSWLGNPTKSETEPIAFAGEKQQTDVSQAFTTTDWSVSEARDRNGGDNTPV